MRILFINKENIFTTNTWSGIPYYIYKNLKEKVEYLDVLSPIKIRYSKIAELIFKVIKKIIKFISGYDNLDFYNYVIIPAKLNIKIKKFLKNKDNYDAIITTSFVPFVYYKNNIPLVIITDATVKRLYADYSNYSEKQYYFIQRQSKKATNNAKLIISSSDYISDSLINDYKLPKDKVRTIPFGANIDDNVNFKTVREIDKSDTVNFIFVGRDFKRKGGDITIEICDKLRLKGVNLNLYIVGTKIPKEYKRDYIINYEFLNKDNPAESKKLLDIYNNAHFFIMPSRAEMYGIVFCEAAAMGLPVITSNKGGITQIVKDNETGIVMELNGNYEKYIEEINLLINDKEKYMQMSKNARKRYLEELNWKIFSEKLINSIQEII